MVQCTEVAYIFNRDHSAPPQSDKRVDDGNLWYDSCFQQLKEYCAGAVQAQWPSKAVEIIEDYIVRVSGRPARAAGRSCTYVCGGPGHAEILLSVLPTGLRTQWRGCITVGYEAFIIVAVILQLWRKDSECGDMKY